MILLKKKCDKKTDKQKMMSQIKLQEMYCNKSSQFRIRKSNRQIINGQNELNIKK